jgi:signal transduction histidine kinase
LIQASSNPEKEYILILHSPNFNNLWAQKTVQAVNAAFEQKGIQTVSEELTSLVKDTAQLEANYHRLLRKYPVIPKLVICIGDPVWLITRPLFDREWKDIPTILYYSGDYVPDRLDDIFNTNTNPEHFMIPTGQITKDYNITRIVKPVHIKETVELMEKLQPDMKKIAFICDNRYTSVLASRMAASVIRTYFPELSLEILSTKDMYTQQLLNKVSRYGKDTGILYYAWFVMDNQEGNELLTDNLRRLTDHISDQPVFNLHDMDLSKGNFAGGYYTSAGDLDNILIRVTRDILYGKAPTDIPLVTRDNSRIYLNYIHLFTHSIPVQLYPKNAIYFQRPPGFLEQYKVHIIAMTLILGLLMIIFSLRLRLILQKQRQAERNRQMAIKTEELNKKYRLVLRANHTLIWKWDIKAETIESECESCLEDEQTECKRTDTTSATFFARVHPDDLERTRNIYLRLINEEINLFDIEFRYKMPQEPDIYSWVESFAIIGQKDKQGHLLTLVGGLINITERKRLEEEARKREQAEESNRMKSVFLSNIRHEVRTPLNAIVGFSNLIVQGCNPEEATEYNKIILSNSALLMQLIDDVLDLSDIESGQANFSYSQVDIAEMVQMLEQIYHDRTQDGVVLTSEIPSHSLFAYTDGNKLAQVLKNLLSNACKFTSSGSIRFGFKLTMEGLYFYISDTGKGIAEADIPHVFDRFSKADSFIQGAGLGLSVSQAIVHKMNGEIGVISEKDKGSTFWFTIPCSSYTESEKRRRGEPTNPHSLILETT